MKTGSKAAQRWAAGMMGLWIVAVWLAPLPARGVSFTWNSGFANAGVVPDANVAGWSDTETVSGVAGNSITGLTVTLDLTGGWNGDLYAYVTDGSGMAVLLNRVGIITSPGVGYGDSGMDVTFSDSAANGDIHLYQTVPGYATSISDGSDWQPDGRAVSPLTVAASDPRTALLNSFDGLNPNGNWTLFVADLSGGYQSTVTSWGLNIDATSVTAGVPDSGGTLPLLALACAGLAVLRGFQGRRGGALVPAHGHR